MQEKDSYQKFADDIFGDHRSGYFTHVKDCDVDEVRVNFAINVAHLEYADNFRIFPLNMSEEYIAKRNRGCCGSWNSQFKCLSGNVYWVGCNYGH